MRVLVLNCGSSSVKFAVIDTQTKESISSGLVENIGVNGHVKAKGPAGNIHRSHRPPRGARRQVCEERKGDAGSHRLHPQHHAVRPAA